VGAHVGIEERGAPIKALKRSSILNKGEEGCLVRSVLAGLAVMIGLIELSVRQSSLYGKIEGHTDV
jgi:hypothetical protein